VSDLCDEHDLNPTMYYRWQKEFFEGGASAFAKESSRQVSVLKQRLADAESRLARKNEVLAEVMEEYVRCKKNGGEPLSGRWVERALRDEVVGFVEHWAARTELPRSRLLSWLGLVAGSTTTGARAAAGAMATTALNRAISGCSRTSARPSSPSPSAIRWRATGA
jgi:transposase